MASAFSQEAGGTYAASLKRSQELELEIAADPSKFRVLTGDRPTGQLHIGHLFGSILGRRDLQARGLDTFLLIADYQVITDRDELDGVKDNTYGLILDNLAAGVDPEKCTYFAHSQVPELNQLIIPFLSLITEPELHRNPTVKAELEAINSKTGNDRQMSGLMLTYPVHQAADILFCKGNVVPVGKDQLPHIEVTRTLARRFNERFAGVDYSKLDENGNPQGLENAVFPEAEALLSKTPHIPGLDGQKMSKSLGNTIQLSWTADETAKAIKKSPTDQDRDMSYDPENRAGVSALLTIAAVVRGLETGGVGEQVIADEVNAIENHGAGTLKALLTEEINEYLRPHREKRAELNQDPEFIWNVLRRGNQRAREIAIQTLNEVQNAMGTVY
jgi:tryptophanyl-tRNA synthetase